MKTQSYSSHARYVPGYHFVTLFIIVTINVLAVINFLYVVGKRLWLYTGLMPLLVSIVLLLLFFYAREFALSVQDRAIREEENLRHFILTGKPLHSELKRRQIIALRFAPDEEFVLLAERAVKEKMSATDIKKAIVNWRADHYRA